MLVVIEQLSPGGFSQSSPQQLPNELRSPSDKSSLTITQISSYQPQKLNSSTSSTDNLAQQEMHSNVSQLYINRPIQMSSFSDCTRDMELRTFQPSEESFHDQKSSTPTITPSTCENKSKQPLQTIKYSQPNGLTTSISQVELNYASSFSQSSDKLENQFFLDIDSKPEQSLSTIQETPQIKVSKK